MSEAAIAIFDGSERCEKCGFVHKEGDTCLSGFERMSDDELREAIRRSFMVGVQSIHRAAMAWRVAEGRGIDLSDLRFRLANYVRRVAHGQMLPEVIAVFYGAPRERIEKIASLPLPDQKKAVDGQIKTVVKEEGKTTYRLLHPNDMTTQQFRQVFASDHIRSETEQIALLSSRETYSEKAKAQPTSCYVDRKKCGLKVDGPTFISKEQLRRFLEELDRVTK